jgi:hypothetical protein
MSLMLFDKGVLVGASETTYNTDAVGAALTANEDITYLAVNEGVNMQRVDEQFTPSRLRASISGVAHTMIPDHNSLEFSAPLKAWRGGTSGNETPYYDWVLKACNFTEAVTDATSAVYTLQTTNSNSASVYYYVRNAEDGKHRLMFLTGGRGNISFNFAVKQEATYSTTMLGASNNDWSDDLAFFDSSSEPALDSSGSSITYTGTASRDDADRTICRSITFTVGGTTYPVNNLSLDCAMTSTPVELMTASQAASKIINVREGNTRANGSFQLIDGATAYEDMLTKWKASTEAALVVSLDDGTNDITFNAPNIQLGPPQRTNVGGIAATDLTFFLNGDYSSDPFGDNELTITYQAGA